ncbi:MAG: potassium-transporting ATPase subunit [Solirubrobacterales bacterium]|nr:potassium-transporting ATPase subunit [Solirubrobacterales bacterium]
MPLPKEVLTAIRAMVVLTLVLGLAYPLAVTGVAQVVMPGKANGSFIKQDGKVVGSKLLGVAPTIDTGRKDADGNPITAPDPAFFQPRPSATGYATDTSFFSNRGPNSDTARQFYKDEIAAYLALNAKSNPGLKASTIPVDAVTTSASGVDPDISIANATIQARRVAAARGLDLSKVMALVSDHTHGRFVGVFGERGVNVPELNLALSNQKAA